ncbi:MULTISPECIES: DUF6308 family protein [unclassified Modestobacter]|uniref:DUF6308 family protein n=1 Tax=unclassified Modestobacter TaxID=2643866 RepID=UPI0022AA1CD8|nr:MULTISPECIES: DUF6308 family protein [unclassified Modestobacter]MCZ2826733.1 DUF6308 family protein [Modestobacter sp. VKM Ac-2981]MCZ2855113.1 DUF6308 family protein [Modestobacter sp. VKM Ac-2982]
MLTGRPDLALPSAGPDPLPWPTALAAVLGYARGRRPLRYRSPNERDGRWVQVPAFGYERFDARPVPAGPLGDEDVLVAEGLHGRLDPDAWSAVRTALDAAEPVAAALAGRAAGRAFWELPDDELSVLGEPGTVGAALRGLGELPEPQRRHVSAALHHRRPDLVPLLHRATWLQTVPHLREGDSGTAAVVHRELRANEDAFAALEEAAAALLDVPLTRLRLHDVLVWLSGTLRLSTAVALGETTEEWRRSPCATR